MTSSIKKLREGLGLTQEDLAEKVGVVHTTIGRWENGREVKKKYRKKLADALGVEMANLIFEAEEIRAAKKVSDTVAVEVDVSFENVPILGTVEAGNYETAERREGDDVAYVTLPIDERCEGKKRFCLEVRGNSMNKEFKPGSWVVCVEFDVFNDEVEDGAVYVVDHKLHGETDSTLKELRIREDGKAYLWPNSDDPAHQQPLEMKGPEDTEISIRSKVVGAYYIR